MFLLLGSKLRRKLLTYSFTHPDENHYVRELSLLIDEDPGNLSRELKRLENEGVYHSVTKGRVKYYSLNRNYPLFHELKEIIFKTEGVQGSLKDLVQRYKGITLAFLYGSYAKEKERISSDIDLVVVGEFSRSSFTRDIRKLESTLNREINFTAYTPKEFEKERSKKGSFLNLVLKEEIILLKGTLDAK
ncbi:MAG: nucleotidyltransferase domain-containing protein [Desulfobacterota bacterium]|nr:nucleotidyltransferase domain-containing protein [Thermodesulfobacteriota bacterium]